MNIEKASVERLKMLIEMIDEDRNNPERVHLLSKIAFGMIVDTPMCEESSPVESEPVKPLSSRAIPMPPKDELLSKFLAGGSEYTLSKEYHVSTTTICRWLRKYKITKQHGGKTEYRVTLCMRGHDPNICVTESKEDAVAAIIGFGYRKGADVRCFVNGKRISNRAIDIMLSKCYQTHNEKKANL